MKTKKYSRSALAKSRRSNSKSQSSNGMKAFFIALGLSAYFILMGLCLTGTIEIEDPRAEIKAANKAMYMEKANMMASEVHTYASTSAESASY